MKYQKIGQKVHFCIKCVCGAIPMDLDVDIRQVFLELVSFYEIIIGKPQTPTSFERQGGGLGF